MNAVPALDHYLRVYDGRLDAAMCDRLVQTFHALSAFHKVNGAGVRAGLDQSGWTELNVTHQADAAFLGWFRQHIDAALQQYNRDVGLSIPIPSAPGISDLVMKRYVPGGAQRFQLHFDSIYEHANRYLVFLWYLNDVAEGGETVFPDLGITVKPEKGRLLMFPPYWMYQHAGQPPVSGDKYILSTYMLFGSSQTGAPYNAS